MLNIIALGQMVWVTMDHWHLNRVLRVDALVFFAQPRLALFR